MSMPVRWQMQDLIDEHKKSGRIADKTTEQQPPICDACKVIGRGSSVLHGHQHFIMTMVTKGVGTQVLNGEEIPGYKVVAGRGSRKWSNGPAVVAELETSGYGNGLILMCGVSAEEAKAMLAKADGRVAKVLEK